jgi:hypothetical protein
MRRMFRGFLLPLVAFIMYVNLAHAQTPVVLDSWCSANGYTLSRDGTDDDSHCVSAAVTYAESVNSPLYIPAGGPILMGGAYQATLNNITIYSQSWQDRSTLSYVYGRQAAVFWMTDTAKTPFLIGSNSITIDGLNFYWPKQDNTASIPITYPALFAPITPTGITRALKIRHVNVQNAFDFLDYHQGIIGNVDIGDSDIYAIRYTFQTYSVPEVFFVHDSLFSWGVDNLTGGNLPTYSGSNGEWLRVAGAGSSSSPCPATSASSITTSNVYVYGERYGIHILGSTGSATAGCIYLGSISGGGFDSVETILQIDPYGKIGAFSFSNKYWKAKIWGIPTQISCGAVCVNNANYFGVQFSNLYIQANGTVFNLQGYNGLGPQISNSQANTCVGLSSSTCYFIESTAGVPGNIQVVGNQIVGQTGTPKTNTNYGISVANSAVISSNQFYNQYESVNILTSLARIVISGNESTSTSGPHDVTGGGTNVISGLNAWSAP